jgi:hypothetical protein
MEGLPADVDMQQLELDANGENKGGGGSQIA